MENNKYKILILEDDKFFLDLYSKKFAENGFNVSTAFEGNTFLKILEDQKDINILIIDLLVPELSGFDVLKSIKDKYQDRKIIKIVMSNLYEDDDIAKAFAMGIDDYVIKSSVTPNEMVERVSGLIKKHNL